MALGSGPVVGRSPQLPIHSFLNKQQQQVQEKVFEWKVHSLFTMFTPQEFLKSPRIFPGKC